MMGNCVEQNSLSESPDFSIDDKPHSSARPISDISSYFTIEVGSASFALHKFPLVSRSGRIRKLLQEAKDTKVSRINLTGLPSGSDAFELAESSIWSRR
ncbi:BTB/POZ domain-containing protein SETH6 [Capsicum chinense]|nr:BTB/POZ domain-containing protein SETH6 [Capsicum chinense]